ncbi:MAG: efflux RND transporter periplasmic adaptor subunit [Thermovirgaceae bacterium]|nr:efflux RND transporter periplasmic adaptor subunit [Thermovirgaceae bacterium]
MTIDARTRKELIALAVLAAVLLFVFQRREIIALFNGDAADPAIRATGTVEIETVDVSAEVGGVISFLAFKESEEVRSGDLLARIDRPDLRAQLERDAAGAALAAAMLEDLKRGSRTEEIAQARAARDAALASFRQAERDAKRFASLFDAEVISRKELEQAVLAEELAASSLKRAGEALAVFEAGPRADQVAAQKEAVKQARAVLAMTQSQLEKTEVRSPAEGTVLTRNFETGELAAQGSVLFTIGRYSECHVRIYIPSTMLGLVTPGQAADVRVDSFPDTVFRGSVSEIAQRAEFTPRQSITPDERANLVFRVKVDVENPEGLLKPGMPADVTLQ